MADRRNSGYARQDRDFYPTPAWVTHALLEMAFLPHKIWEPACGQGHMFNVLEDSGHEVLATDIFENSNYVKSMLVEDFLTTTRNVDAVVTNPPFNLATEFAEKGLEVTKKNKGRVALLLPTDFDHARRRRHLYGDCPAFHRKIVLTSRIRWFEGTPEDKGKQPMGNHAWFIWDWNNEGNGDVVYHYR